MLEDLSLVIPARQFAVYNFKFQKYNCQFLHFEWQTLLKLLGLHLGETTVAELSKAIKSVEKWVKVRD